MGPAQTIDGSAQRGFKASVLVCGGLGSVNRNPYSFDPYGEANSVEIDEGFAEHLVSGFLSYKTKSSHSGG
jgi:hypothetical protein